jgi:lipopolysaccharide transport system ATP-binding protein
MSAIIRVENLGKKYTLRHQGAGGAGYRRFSEELLDAIKRPFRRATRRAANGQAREEFWALREVSFEVQQGEVLGIIGRNGAGKSTLLKILSRITEPTEGRVRLKGRVASLLEVGTGFHPELTGRENVFLNGAVLGMYRAEIKRKFDEIVAFAEVEKFLDTPVKHYSSGMYVRLAFAVAAHLEPEILIVDEVLAVGDVQFQKKCLGKMSEVATAGRTVLFVSHNMQAIKQLTQRVLVLASGEIVADRTTDHGIAHYKALGRGADGSPGVYKEQVPGSGPRVVAVEVVTSDGNGIHVCGRDLVVRFEIETPEACDDLTFSFQLVDEAGIPECNVWYQDPSFARPDHLLGSLRPGRHVMSCRLPSFPAFMGSYTVTGRLFSLKERRHVQILHDVAPFEIMMPDGVAQTFPWSPGSCRFMVNAIWGALNDQDSDASASASIDELPKAATSRP